MNPFHLRNGCVLAGGIATVLLVSVAGCNQSKESSATSAPQPASPTVSVVHPERTNLTVQVSQPGTVQAYENTAIFSKIPGYVLKWHVDIDDHVTEGQLLAELYVPELAEELKHKEELVKQAREALEVAKARVASAAASVQEAKARVQR